MPYCKICFKKIRRVNWSNLFFKTPICNDCRKKLTPKFFEFQLEGVKGTAIFDYDETIRSLLFQFKGQYDIELANIFLEYYASYFHLRFRDFIIVPAPSSKESDEKREFNHVEEMFKVLKLPIIKIFYKKENYKQSDLNSLERKKVEEKIGLTENFDISNKKILIVDDLMTTGSTIRAMIKLLRKLNPMKVEVLVMAHTIAPKDRK